MKIKPVLYKTGIIIAGVLLIPLVINSVEYITRIIFNLGRYCGEFLRCVYESAPL